MFNGNRFGDASSGILSKGSAQKLIRVLADDDGPHVTSDVVPTNSVVVVVIEHGQTGLIVPLLKAFHGQADIVLDVL